MMINFGDVLMVDFGEQNIGSIQGGKRPAIVIQNDIGNKYSPTSIVIPLTSEIKKLNMPCHRVLHKSNGNGLLCDSTVLGEQVRVIDKTTILYRMGRLSDAECRTVLAAYFANVPKGGIMVG